MEENKDINELREMLELDNIMKEMIHNEKVTRKSKKQTHEKSFRF